MIADIGSGESNSSAKSAWHHFYALAGLLVLILGGQLLGLEVVGGDPDKFFRPLKSEFVRNIIEGRLPLWSDLFGFGMPLAGQSEIGAFYLPHHLSNVWCKFRISTEHVFASNHGSVFFISVGEKVGIDK